MFLVDRIKENQNKLNNDPQLYMWSGVNDVDNRPVYFEIQKNGARICVSARNIKGLDLYQEDIANGYINETIVQDVKSALDKKNWQVEVDDYPSAFIDVVVSKKDKSMYVDDFATFYVDNPQAYENKLMMMLLDLCANVGCSTLKALPSKEKKFKGVHNTLWPSVKKGEKSIFRSQSSFTEESYEKFLSKNGFEKKFFSSCYSKNVSKLCFYDMKKGNFGLFYDTINGDKLNDYIRDCDKSM